MPLAFPVRVSFGYSETLNCIRDVPLQGPAGEALCLGYKTSSYSVLLPLYLKNDGYVLVVNARRDAYYPLPSADRLALAQSTGGLPSPLPAYSIPLTDYAFGYAVWLILGGSLLVALVHHQIRKSRLDALAKLTPSSGPLTLRTETDRWLTAECAKWLAPGETVQAQAYGLDRRDANQATRAMYVVITNQRVCVLRSRIAGAPKRECIEMKSYDRQHASALVLDERHVHLTLPDAPAIDLFVEWSERHLSNQRRFLVELPELFAAQTSAA